MRAAADQTLAIAPDFNERYQILIADTEALRREVYQVRCQVFCDELGYDMKQSQGCESDEYDDASLHVLLRHRASDRPIGCFRLVMPQPGGQIWLPFDLYGVPHVDKTLFDWNSVNYSRSVEVSRLALSSSVRRCDNATTGPSSPFLATAMFYAVNSLVVNRNIENVFMVIEPRLGRLTSRFGNKLDQISRPFEYYGPRATFTTTGQRLRAESHQLKRPWRDLFDVVESQLYADLKAPVQVQVA